MSDEIQLPEPSVRPKLELLPAERAERGWKRPGDWSACRHEGQKRVDEHKHAVFCGDCGEQVDPIVVLLEFVDFWRRCRWELDTIAQDRKKKVESTKDRRARRDRDHEWLREQGRQAQKRGRPSSSCPYKAHWRRRLWQDGFDGMTAPEHHRVAR